MTESGWNRRLTDGRSLGEITYTEGLMIAAGATPEMAGTIFRKAEAAGCRLEQRTDASWAVIAESDGLPLLWGSLQDIHSWLRLVKDPAPPAPTI